MVLVCSAAALIGDDLGIGFALAKSANVALVKSLARLWAPRVRVNGVAPGALRTSWLRELSPGERVAAKSKALLERYGEPEEVARVIGELALGPSRFQTGQILVLDGGVAL
jgi:3-oxoacyl-[acyl-carrier protein] reductase